MLTDEELRQYAADSNETWICAQMARELLAARDTLRRVRERAELLRYDTSALMSSPPQNAAVHDLLQILDEATR